MFKDLEWRLLWWAGIAFVVGAVVATAIALYVAKALV